MVRLSVYHFNQGVAMSKSVSLVAGVVVERVGDDLLVVVPGNTSAVSLSGRSAEVLADVEAGKRVDSSELALRELVELGIVSAPGLSRRGLIKAGAIGAGASIAVLSFPSAAMASSGIALTGSGIALTGSWAGGQGDQNDEVGFETTGFDFDDSLGSSGGASGTDPSPLSVQTPSVTVPMTAYQANPADGDLNANFVHWDGPQEPFSAAIAAKSTLVGSFTWGGTLFTVTFTFFEI